MPESAPSARRRQMASWPLAEVSPSSVNVLRYLDEYLGSLPPVCHQDRVLRSRLRSAMSGHLVAYLCQGSSLRPWPSQASEDRGALERFGLWFLCERETICVEASHNGRGAIKSQPLNAVTLTLGCLNIFAAVASAGYIANGTPRHALAIPSPFPTISFFSCCAVLPMSEKVKEQPFTLSVPDAALDLLRKKLDLVCFPDELEDAGWDYGVPLAHIKRLVERWRHGYDWRRSEEVINKLPMFTRDIQVDGFGTLNVHYVHKRSDAANAIPLLFVHGWPGHFLESRKLLPLLTVNKAGKPSFHVVALSLPGYGFSEAPKRRGFAGAQYAEVCNKLMLSLGYNHYVYQGGDWGHVVGLNAVTRYGHRHIKAWHTNCPITDVGVSALLSQPRVLFNMLAYPFDKQAQKALAQTKRHFSEGSGYMIQQATRPQTIGHCLADSPVGLLAWIYEKLVNWSDGYPWSDDEVLEWVSIYWFSRAGPTASARMYYEMTGGNKNFFRGVRWTSVPLGISHFPREVARLPKSWMRLLGNVVFQSEHDKGGHFAAYEQPEKLADDLRRMFGAGGPAHDTFPELKAYA